MFALTFIVYNLNRRVFQLMCKQLLPSPFKSLKNEPITITNVQSFLNAIDALKETYSNSVPLSTPFLYRGIGNETYSLLPGIFRPLEGNREGNDRHHSYGKNTELDILQEFKSQASSYPVKISDKTNLFEWAELAQHYGVPTRFLDWTENPLVSLYFACSSNQDNDAAIWVLHKENYHNFICKNENSKNIFIDNKLAINELFSVIKETNDDSTVLFEYPLIYTPYYFEQRMSAQASWFMVWGKNHSDLMSIIDQNHLMTVDSKQKRKLITTADDPFICKFIIKSNQKHNILRQIDTLGINAKTLFPGLEGIGKYMEWKYRLTMQEAIDAYFS